MVIRLMNIRNVFIATFVEGKGVIICLYVDDMLIFVTDIEKVEITKAFLSKYFDMKDIREADVILGIRIVREQRSISLSQSHYIEKILNKFNHSYCKPASTPFDPNMNFVTVFDVCNDVH